jgi:hypothetical protein
MRIPRMPHSYDQSSYDAVKQGASILEENALQTMLLSTIARRCLPVSRGRISVQPPRHVAVMNCA